eukprot:1340878-Amorphochlora_amoeboformis.AAC.1
MSKLDPGDPRKDLALENQGGHSVQTMLGIRPQRRTGGRAYAAAGAVFADLGIPISFLTTGGCDDANEGINGGTLGEIVSCAWCT